MRPAGTVQVPAISAARPARPSESLTVPIVHLSGSAVEIGEAHGKAMGATIRLLHERYLNVFLAGDPERTVARLAAKAFEALSLPEHQREIAALATASAIDERDTMLGQCFLDLTPMTACSTVALPGSAAADGVARFGRNLDFPSLGVADKYTTLFIVKQTGRYAFASVGWPGMIGVLTGMNEHGLTLANMEVSRGRRVPTGMPYTLLYRAALERCRTVDEAIAYLRATPRQTANNLMLMDAAGDRAVVELTPEAVVVRRGEADVALLSTNHQRGADAATAGLCTRYDYMKRQSARDFGGIDGRAVEAMLQHVGNATTLQAMIFEPANRAMYLSAGTGAAGRAFTRIELGPLMR